MASAIFIAPMTDTGPTLDMEQLLTETPQDGYGYSVIGQVPQAGTCLVRVWSSDTVIDVLAADANYEFVEDIDDGEGS